MSLSNRYIKSPSFETWRRSRSCIITSGALFELDRLLGDWNWHCILDIQAPPVTDVTLFKTHVDETLRRTPYNISSTAVRERALNTLAHFAERVVHVAGEFMQSNTLLAENIVLAWSLVAQPMTLLTWVGREPPPRKRAAAKTEQIESRTVSTMEIIEPQ